MPLVGEVDHIYLDDKSQQIEYPYLEVSDISLVNQVTSFTSGKIKDGADVLTVPVYGVKGRDQLKYIGQMILSAGAVLRMEYLGLKVKYHESPTQSTDFCNPDHLVQICTNKELIKECLL